MTEKLFDLGAGPARQRLEQLSHRAEDLPAEAREVAHEILEAFSISIEELQVAAEELHQQNQELLASREEIEIQRRRYWDLFEFAPHGYLVTDPRGLIREANQAAVDLLGVSRLGLVGKPLVVYVTAGERDRFHRHLDRLTEGQARDEVELEIRIQPRGGPAFPAALTIAPARNAAGELAGLRWLVRDISASKRAEERERLLAQVRKEQHRTAAANRLSQALIDTMPVGAMIADAEGTLLLTNAAAQRILGSEVRGTLASPERTHTTHYPNGAPMSLEEMPLAQALRDGRTVEDVEVLIRRADGDERTILASAAPVRDEAGHIVTGIAIFQDTTARKRARAERERLLTILEATPDLVSMATVEGEVIYLNRAARHFMGPSGSAPDMRTQDAIPRARHPLWSNQRIEEEAIPTATGEGVWRGRATLVDSGGRRIPVSQVVLAHPGPEGTPAYLSTIARDVGERERIMLALQEERARFAAVFENTPEAILVADAESRIVMANEAAHELYRRPVPFHEPFDPHPRVQVLHPDGRPFEREEYPILRSVVDREPVHQMEMVIVWEDGVRRHMLVSSTPCRTWTADRWAPCR